MKCAVIGLGEFGRAMAVSLARNGAEVIAVDKDLVSVDKVKDHVALAVCMDASQEEALRTHGMEKADVLIAAIGGDFESQVLVVVFGKKMGVQKVIARATSNDHARILLAVGADEIINPEQEAARVAVQRLMIPNISSYFELTEGFSVVEINAPAGLVGKSLITISTTQQSATAACSTSTHLPNFLIGRLE